MKRFLNAAAMGAIFGLAALLSSALALSVVGRNSTDNRNILQAGLFALSTDLGVTATASGTQANSYQLTAGFTSVTTVTTIGDSVKLPSIQTLYSPSNLDASLNVVIANTTGNAMNVWPFLTTDAITGNGAAGAAGAVMAIAANKTAICWASTAQARWYCVVG
jgi:hypothetical protein